MSDRPTTVAELIGLWPSAEQFARDLGLKHTSHGRAMRSRGSINERWWDQVVVAASRRGFEGVTHSLLTEIHFGSACARSSRRGPVSSAEPRSAA